MQKAQDGKAAMKIAKQMKMHPSTVSNILKHYKNSKDFLDKPRSWRPPSARTKYNVKIIPEKTDVTDKDLCAKCDQM